MPHPQSPSTAVVLKLNVVLIELKYNICSQVSIMYNFLVPFIFIILCYNMRPPTRKKV